MRDGSTPVPCSNSHGQPRYMAYCYTSCYSLGSEAQPRAASVPQAAFLDRVE